MIRKLLATTALAGVIATGAYAQDAAAPANSAATPAASSGTMPSPDSATADAAAKAPVAPGTYLQKLGADQYLVSNLNDKSIYPSTAEDAKSIGDIQNFLIGKDGKVVAAVADVTLADQSKTIAIPFDKISWSMGSDSEPRAVLSGGADSLGSASAFVTPEEKTSTDAPAAGSATTPATGTASVPAPAAGGTMASSSDAASPTDTSATTTAANDSGGFPTSVGSDQYLSENIIGQDVFSGPGEDADDIGGINDLVIASSGKVEAGVVGVGGFLGIGEKDVAVPFDQFMMTRGEDNAVRVTLAATKDQLNQAPSFVSDRDADETASNTTDNDATATDTAADQSAATATGGAAATGAAVGSAMNSGGDSTQQTASNAADSTPAATGDAGTATTGAATGSGVAAADSSSSTDSTASTGGSDRPSQLTPVTDQSKLTADNLIGTTVYGPNDTTVGDIGDIALNTQGQVDAVIIDVGGFLGIGEKPVAVAMDNLKFMQDANGSLYLQTQFTQEQLNNAPEYNADTYTQNRSTMRLEDAPTTGQSSNTDTTGTPPATNAN